MDDLKKIDLVAPEKEEKSNLVKESLKRGSKGKISKKVIISLFVVALFVVISVFSIVLPAQKALKSTKATMAQAQKALDAVKKQNIGLAEEELNKTQTDLKQAQKDFNSLSFLKYIPIARGYYNDGEHLIKAAGYGLESASVLVQSIKPYADVLGLKGQGSFVMGTAEQRVQTAVMTMGKITPKIDDIAGSMVSAKKEIDQVDPNHYPSFFGGDKIKKQIISMKTLVDEAVTGIDEARPLIKILPSMLGEDKERKYLVLFQNDKELRPTGGFITAYAIFRIDKGIIHVDRSEDIYNLDNSIPNKAKAPAPILKYLPNVYTFNLRDSNISPDFVESMHNFEKMYKRASGSTNVDGIIAIDTSILVSTIKILDDEVYAGGIKFTSKEDPRCNCPQVIYTLEDTISRPVNYQKGTTRKDLLGTLLYAIMEKALKSSPKQYWGPLFQDMFKKSSEKHVLYYFYNKDAQDGVEALNVAGRIKAFDGDYLHVNDTNFGGQKSNMFVSESVDQNYDIKSDGTITKTIDITYKNPYPPSDCNLERGGLCLNAILRNWFRIYVPKGSELVSSSGSEVKVTSYEELGKTVFDGFLTVRPGGGITKLSLTYKLPFKLASGSPLPLFIQKQPGTYDNAYTISVNGRKSEEFKLTTDKEVKIKH